MSNKIKRPVRRPGQTESFWPGLLVIGGVILLGVAAYFLWGTGAGGSSAPVEVQGTPRLKVDRETIDLGDVKLGQTVEARFRLTNVGDQPLRFAEVPYIEVVEGC